MKKKVIIAVVCIVGFIGALLFGLSITPDKAYLSEEKQIEATEKIEQYTKEFEEKDDGFISFGNEREFQQILHEMTHQKVKASQKWGFTLMTPERIDYLLEALDEKEFEHEELYREILTEWKNGDFSNAVEAHNTIWDMQGGNVGKAKRLLTPEEERQYLEKQLK